jgi:hypothetical protein
MGVDDAILLLCDTVTRHSKKNCLNTDGGPATDFEPPLLLFKQSVLVKLQIFMLANDQGNSACPKLDCLWNCRWHC